jgi:hypothetical protein
VLKKTHVRFDLKLLFRCRGTILPFSSGMQLAMDFVVRNARGSPKTRPAPTRKNTSRNTIITTFRGAFEPSDDATMMAVKVG